MSGAEIVVTAAIAVVCLGIVAVFVLGDIRASRDDLPLQSGSHALAPIAPASHHRARQLPPEWRCAPLRSPMTIRRAQFEMQDHKHCSLDACPRKNQAHALLVFSGKIIPQR
jgi:hypothetical protein